MSPLDFKTQAVLGKVSPSLVWEQVKALVYQAFEVEPDESQQLMEKYQPPFDQGGLELALQHLDPEVGVNNLQYIQKGLDLQNLMKSPPLQVLEQVLRMVSLSDKWQSEVSI